MSKSQGGVLIALAICVVAFLALMFFHRSARWEYRVTAVPDSELVTFLSKAGGDGWELITARRAVDENTPPQYEMIFKRPIGP